MYSESVYSESEYSDTIQRDTIQRDTILSRATNQRTADVGAGKHTRKTSRNKTRKATTISSALLHGALCAAIGLLAIGNASAQVVPYKLDKTRLIPNARAQGMGSIYLTMLNDATAAIFNPALLADAGNVSFSLQMSSRNNVPYWDALRYIDDLNKVTDQIKNDPANVNWDSVIDHLDNLYDFAQQAVGNIIDGKPIYGKLSVAPAVGLSYKNVGIVSYGGVAGVAQLISGNGTGPYNDKRTLSADGGFLDLLTIAVPYSFRLGDGYMGVSAKYIRADYTGVSFIADASNRVLTGRAYNHERDAHPDIDLGYRTDLMPVSGSVPVEKLSWQMGGTIRYLLSPTFTLPATIRKESDLGGEAPPPADFSYRLYPAIDLGGNIGGRIGNRIPWRTAIELHNMTGVNGGSLSFHGGGEIMPLKGVSLRGGYDRDQFVYGVGFALGPVRLDASAGIDYRNLLSVGVSARF